MFNQRSCFPKMVYNLKKVKNMSLENVSIVEMDGYMQEIHLRLSYKNEAPIKKEWTNKNLHKIIAMNWFHSKMFTNKDKS